MRGRLFGSCSCHGRDPSGGKLVVTDYLHVAVDEPFRVYALMKEIFRLFGCLLGCVRRLPGAGIGSD